MRALSWQIGAYKMSTFRKKINYIMDKFGYKIEKASPAIRFHQAALEYNLILSKQICEEYDYTVQAGAFIGLRLLPNPSWGALDVTAKLVGAYEEQLSPLILEAVAQRPDCVVNIGCADGYYAVGLRRLLPDAAVLAFDIDPRAEAELAQTESLNGVRVAYHAGYDWARPLPEIMACSKPFFVLDCEGAEQHLPEIPAELVAKSTFLIETHDSNVPGVTRQLSEFLSPSHAVVEIVEGGRNPFLYPALRNLDCLEKYLLLSEFRGRDSVKWIYAAPK